MRFVGVLVVVVVVMVVVVQRLTWVGTSSHSDYGGDWDMDGMDGFHPPCESMSFYPLQSDGHSGKMNRTAALTERGRERGA